MQENLQKSNEFCSKTPQKSNELRAIGRNIRRRADLAVFECGTNRVLATVRRGEIIHEQK